MLLNSFCVCHIFCLKNLFPHGKGILAIGKLKLLFYQIALNRIANLLLNPNWNAPCLMNNMAQLSCLSPLSLSYLSQDPGWEGLETCFALSKTKTASLVSHLLVSGQVTGVGVPVGSKGYPLVHDPLVPVDNWTRGMERTCIRHVSRCDVVPE